MLICPFFGDQAFWGRRMYELGVGPAPLPEKRLTIEKFVHGLEQVVTDEGIRQRATTRGNIVRAEQGVERAAYAILQQLT